MKTVDLFAGCGGLSMGFENAGFDIVAAFEFWGTAAKCYELNFQHPVYTTDLSDIRTAVRQIQEYKPDLIIGGPPCQDFSHAGKRIEAARASLTASFAKIVSTVHPKYFVMENVDRAQTSDAYAEARKIFKDSGYGLTEIVLDASLCGVPQKRKRFFCIGILEKPDGFALDNIHSRLSDHGMTLREYFGSTLDFEYYYRHPRNYSRRGIFSIDEPAPTMRGVNRPVPKGYPGNPNDACPLNDSIRALTTLERSLIQTFPADFKWYGSKTEMEQMIGNAVPVKLAEFVANTLNAFIDTSFSYDRQAFKRWIEKSGCYSTRTINDIACRVNRCLELYPATEQPNDLYLFKLENSESFHALSANVRSQLRRAMKIFIEYLNTNK